MDLEQWKSAMSMIPDVTEADVAAALCAAKLKLRKPRRDRLRGELNMALHDYVVDRLYQAQRTRRARPRTKVIAPGKKREGRHFGDQSLQAFFGQLNGIWTDSFGRLPSATWNAHKGGLEGAYITFAESILRSYADKVPDELNRLAPGLRARLRLSRRAIHGRFRRTRISRVRGIAQRMLDSLDSA